MHHYQLALVNDHIAGNYLVMKATEGMLKGTEVMNSIVNADTNSEAVHTLPLSQCPTGIEDQKQETERDYFISLRNPQNFRS